jgi:hypothetical protein
MKKTRFLISIGILVLFLQSCCNRNEGYNIQDNSNMNNNEFLGEWYSVERMIPFGAVLNIDLNYNFTYEGGACVSRFGSKGQWIIENDTLILNSTYPEKCYYIINFYENCVIIDPDDLPISKKAATSIKDCTPELLYEYVIFDNEKFIIKDSVLIHIQNNQCIEATNNFTKIKPPCN